MNRSPRAAVLVALMLLLSAAALMAGCTQQQPLTVGLSDHPTYGKILTDSTGRSLYIQARDVPNTGAVANLGELGRFYPPFYAESVVDGNGINVSEFGYLTRADGKRQTTYRGWPLYYYLNDKAPGDAKSQGANNNTFLAKPDYTIMVHENVTRGVYLVDPTGAALLVQDGPAAGPAEGYVPFRVSRVVGPSPLVQAADFGETVGPSGESLTMYRGQPLYLYGGQNRPGAIAGDANGYRAVIIAPGGALTGNVEAPTAAPTPIPSTEQTGTPVPSTPATTSETAPAVTTRSGDGAYTGGVYTPTPFRTVQVISQGSESATPSSIWTPVVTGAITATPATPPPTVSGSPTASVPQTTLSPAIPTAPVGSRTTPARTTTVPTISTPVTLQTTIPPITTTATTVPQPITTIVTTVPQPITSPTTLPLPFPITTSLPPNPAVSTQLGNTS